MNPKKITPDRIKGSFIEVRYNSELPFEVLVGFFFKALDQTYTYTNRPVGLVNQMPNLKDLPKNYKAEITLPIGGSFLFYNDKIKIELKPNAIIFNCLNDYISWGYYKPEIEKVLKQFSVIDVIKEYSRVGVRYISHYPEMNIQKCTKFQFTFGLPEITSEAFLFNTQFPIEDYKVILNLSNQQPIFSQVGEEFKLVPTSIIDIDVITDNFTTKDIGILNEKIEAAHNKEKDIFFSLLKEDFLKSLNPQY